MKFYDDYSHFPVHYFHLANINVMAQAGEDRSEKVHCLCGKNIHHLNTVIDPVQVPLFHPEARNTRICRNCLVAYKRQKKS